MLVIRKTGRAKFRIYHPHKPSEAISLDFNPIIKAHGLVGNFQLHHFQAKPKPERSFGFYDSATDSYQAYAEMDLPAGRMIAIDESKFNVVPTSVFVCTLPTSEDPKPQPPNPESLPLPAQLSGDQQRQPQADSSLPTEVP